MYFCLTVKIPEDSRYKKPFDMIPAGWQFLIQQAPRDEKSLPLQTNYTKGFNLNQLQIVSRDTFLKNCYLLLHQDSNKTRVQEKGKK